ncbi:hypothetical protein HQN90_17840 [Paenibacillus alba]|uniref:Gp138 family membrane-puncturing spike protein n=1 Tax=Paenibacillus alba TaxID=1197127 RepID=UPI0015644863|nr:Gp138 family membrane-puncturing spike protein [Paenibacillus alba]NQX67987.1 hypothetical protein [Paenibacillus alba]
MSTTDAGSAANLFVMGLIAKTLNDLHVGLPCKVISFDLDRCVANIQPLIRTTDKDPAIIQNVPALGQKLIISGAEQLCKPSLRIGDVVFVVCADQEIKNVLSGQIASSDSKRKHSKNDAVIVGVMPCSL